MMRCVKGTTCLWSLTESQKEPDLQPLRRNGGGWGGVARGGGGWGWFWMTGRHGWGTETSKGKGRRCRDLVSGQKRNFF